MRNQTDENVVAVVRRKDSGMHHLAPRQFPWGTGRTPGILGEMSAERESHLFAISYFETLTPCGTIPGCFIARHIIRLCMSGSAPATASICRNLLNWRRNEIRTV